MQLREAILPLFFVLHLSQECYLAIFTRYLLLVFVKRMFDHLAVTEKTDIGFYTVIFCEALILTAQTIFGKADIDKEREIQPLVYVQGLFHRFRDSGYNSAVFCLEQNVITTGKTCDIAALAKLL